MKKFFLSLLFPIIGIMNMLAQSGYVGESISLDGPTVYGTLGSAAWTSDDGDRVSVSGDRNGATATILQYFTGSKKITCTYAWKDYNGKPQSTGHIYYYISCIKSKATIDKSELKLSVGQEATISYTNSSGLKLPNNYWKTDNKKVATVNGKESDFADEVVVKAVASGECTITFDGHCGSDPVTCKVTVVKIDATGMTLSPDPLTVAVGKTATMKYTLTPSDASATLKWKSADESIATVSSSGVVKGISEGSTEITATTENGVEAKAKVEVLGSPKEISLPSQCSVDVGYYYTLVPTLTPTNSTCTFTWKTSDSSIASVSAGRVYGKKAGSCTITATSDNGLTASTTLSVKDADEGLDKATVNYRVKCITNLVNKIKK